MSPVTLRRLTAKRRGLTLVELVVVMAILIALAGIIIPILPGVIGRGETSARATNDSEIYKWVQMYEAMTSQYPYDWDSLIDSSTGTNATYVGGFTTATGNSGPALATTTLTTGQASALTGGGIGSIQQMSNSTATTLSTAQGGSGFNSYSDTFNPYPTNDRAADRLTVKAGITVAYLTAVGQQMLGLADNSTISTTDGTATVPGTGWYIVFGLGKRCSLVGTGTANVGANFFDKFSLDPSPTGSYARYGVVFQTSGVSGLSNSAIAGNTTNSGTGVTTNFNIVDFGRCKFVKVFRFGSTLTTGDDAIKSYWDDVTTVSGS